MKTANTVKQIVLAALTAGVSLLWASAGRAETLTFDRAPAGNVVAQMSHRYGVTIVFRGNINANLPVTFSVDDAETPAGRLLAVSDLANALGLDFQKVYVVSKLNAGATVPDVPIDSSGIVNFPDTKISAREAIETIAALDSAITQISGAVEGDVTLPRRRMSVVDAAALIAKQTQTGWKAYYGLYRPGQEPARLDGEVVDRTSLGQPITELPLLTYRSVAPAPATTAASQAPPASNPAAGTGPNAAMGYGYNPYAYNPYAYNPYAYNPYAYSPYAYSPYGSGNPYGYGYGDTNGGVEQSAPLGNGGNVITVPSGGATVLPDYPFSGGVGPVVVGGY